MKRIITAILLFPILAIAQIPQPQPNTYINDLAGVIPAAARQQINEKIAALEKDYTVQIAVVLINELPEGIEIDDYAREIGRQWHVGNHDNGLVYVASVNQHKQRLEVARRLEGTITDIGAREITEHIKPFFRTKDYTGGILNMLQEIDQRLKPVQAEQKALGRHHEKGMPGWLVFVLCLSGAGLLWFIMWLITKKEKPNEPEKAAEPDWDAIAAKSRTMPPPSPRASQSRDTTIIAPIITTNNYSSRRDDDAPSYGSSSSSSSSDSSSSSYGSWGSDSSSSSSSDSGFSGGGSSNDW